MGIYIYNFLSIPVYSKIFKRKIFIIIASIQMFLILALRADNLGVDLLTYSRGFEYISTLTATEMLSKLNFIQTASLPYPFSFESGWVVLNWIIGQIGFSFHVILVLCAAMNMYAIGKFIYCYSKIPWLSFSIICSLGIYTYMFGILRQALALSFVLMSLMLADKGKLIKAIIILILAFTIHRTAILGGLLLPFFKCDVIRKKRYRQIFMCWIPYFLLSGFIYRRVVSTIMLLFSQGYPEHGGQWNNLMTLLLIIVIGTILFCDFSKIKGKMLIVSFWAEMFAVYLETMGMYNDNFARSVQYYLIFIAIVIPYVLFNYSNKKTAFWAKGMIAILLFLFMIYTLQGSELVPYRILEHL